MSRRSRAKPPSLFRYFNSSPEVIRLVVMMYVRFPLSLRNVEDLLFERGIDISHETVRLWWNRFDDVEPALSIERRTLQEGIAGESFPVGIRPFLSGALCEKHPAAA